MSDTYSPQRHAAAVADSNDLLRYVASQIALMNGKLDRLVQATSSTDHQQDEVFDNLVAAIFKALGNSIWTVSDLRKRANEEDPSALDLASAICSTGGDLSNKRLGKFLVNQVKGQSRAVESGYEIRRMEACRGKVAWSVSSVSD